MSTSDTNRQDYLVDVWAPAADQWNIRQTSNGQGTTDTQRHVTSVPPADTRARRAVRLHEALHAAVGQQQLDTQWAQLLEEMRIDALAHQRGIDTSPRMDERDFSSYRPPTTAAEAAKLWAELAPAACDPESLQAGHPSIREAAPQNLTSLFTAVNDALPQSIREQLVAAAATLYHSPASSTRDLVAAQMNGTFSTDKATSLNNDTGLDAENGQQEKTGEDGEHDPSPQDAEDMQQHQTSPADEHSQEASAPSTPKDAQQPSAPDDQQPGNGEQSADENTNEAQTGSPSAAANDQTSTQQSSPSGTQSPGTTGSGTPGSPPDSAQSQAPAQQGATPGSQEGSGQSPAQLPNDMTPSVPGQEGAPSTPPTEDSQQSNGSSSPKTLGNPQQNGNTTAQPTTTTHTTSSLSTPDTTPQTNTQDPRALQHAITWAPAKETPQPTRENLEPNTRPDDTLNHSQGGVGGTTMIGAMEIDHHISLRSNSRSIRQPEGATDSGQIPEVMERWAEDRQIFRSRRPGGTLLIDCSGSMSWNWDVLKDAMKQFPALTIAVYSGFRNGGGRLCVIAENGRWSDFNPSHMGSGNEVDTEALTWLGQQKGPRIWLSDGYVCGGLVERNGDAGIEKILHIAKTKRIIRADSIDATLGVLRNGGARLVDGTCRAQSQQFIPEHARYRASASHHSSYGMGW